jgi:phenylalanyl-tRNA synthetase alpha subunit
MSEEKYIEQQKKDYNELKEEIKLLHEQIKQNTRNILNSKSYKNNNFKKFDKKIEECINYLNRDKISSYISYYFRFLLCKKLKS